MGFKCEIVADSKNTFGNRITTFLITIPRIVLAELNTHRMFSRNSASSRAIPFKRMRRAVMKDPFIPLNWMKDHSGMQGTEYFTSPVKRWLLRRLWLTARTFAVLFAWCLNKAGLSKQICNRILEPWMWHTVLVTATEYENFFSLRANDQAEIHIQRIAYMMLEEYNKSIPRQLNEGEWHVPFLDKIIQAGMKVIPDKREGMSTYEWFLNMLKVSVAMCARTSYTVVGEQSKQPDFMADVKLHDRLAMSGHWSPFEHVAKPMNNKEISEHRLTQMETGCKIPNPVSAEYENDMQFRTRMILGWSGNFCGFIQYRKYFSNENRSDDRVQKIGKNILHELGDDKW